MLTTNQNRVLVFIQEYRTKKLASPTYREISNFLLLDVKSVALIVNALITKEFVLKNDKTSRSIQLTDKAYELLGVNAFSISALPYISSLHNQTVMNKFGENGASTKVPTGTITYGSAQMKNSNSTTANKMEKLISSTTKFFEIITDGTSPVTIILKIVSVFTREKIGIAIMVLFWFLSFYLFPLVVRTVGKGSEAVMWYLLLCSLAFLCLALFCTYKFFRKP